MKANNLAAALLIVLVASALPLPVLAKTVSSNRYFVKSLSSVWKNSFNARHVFDNGFSADLSGYQLRLAKIFGVQVEPISRLSILEEGQVAAGTLSDRQNGLVPVQEPWNTDLFSGINKSSDNKEESVLIAVLDTGVQVSHPDLKQRIDGCQDFTQKSGVKNNECEDTNGHGTHVAGIIAADGGKDGVGMTGMDPSAKLLIFKVCDETGLCWADDVASAIRASVKEGVQIITISVGSDSESPLVRDAVKSASEDGVLIIAAAGNDGSYSGSLDYPANYASVISVGAVDSFGSVPEWSSRGNNGSTKSGVKEDGDLDFAAPGVDVESTWNNGGYAVLSGTSMAAPHIAGLASRLWDSESKNPAESVRNLLEKLTSDSETERAGFGVPTGYPTQ